MSLAQLVRDMTGVADGLTADLQVAVTLIRVTRRDSSQKPIEHTHTPMSGIFEERSFRPRLIGGMEIVPSGKFTFPRPVDVRADDTFLFEDGELARVIDVVGPGDPNGSRYITEVYLGEKK